MIDAVNVLNLSKSERPPDQDRDTIKQKLSKLVVNRKSKSSPSNRIYHWMNANEHNAIIEVEEDKEMQ